MATQDNEPEQRVVAVVIISLIVLIIGGVLGLGVFSVRGNKPAAPAATSPATPAAVAVSASGRRREAATPLICSRSQRPALDAWVRSCQSW